jgi:hypothetical protein
VGRTRGDLVAGARLALASSAYETGAKLPSLTPLYLELPADLTPATELLCKRMYLPLCHGEQMFLGGGPLGQPVRCMRLTPRGRPATAICGGIQPRVAVACILTGPGQSSTNSSRAAEHLANAMAQVGGVVTVHGLTSQPRGSLEKLIANEGHFSAEAEIS